MDIKQPNHALLRTNTKWLLFALLTCILVLLVYASPENTYVAQKVITVFRDAKVKAISAVIGDKDGLQLYLTLLKITIPIIWSLLAITFYMLGLYHRKIARKEIPLFELRERVIKKEQLVTDKGNSVGSDIEQKIKDFVSDFNQYLAEQNKSLSKQSVCSAVAYWAAATAAIVLTILGCTL